MFDSEIASCSINRLINSSFIITCLFLCFFGELAGNNNKLVKKQFITYIKQRFQTTTCQEDLSYFTVELILAMFCAVFLNA